MVNVLFISIAQRFFIILAVLIIVAIIVFCGIYLTRFRTMSTIKKITSYNDGYNLYSMDVKYDYS